MDYNLQIQKLLVKKEAVALPDDKIRILKEAIALADSHNDIEWGFDLRLEIMEEEYYTSHYTESFPAFTWLLDACDRHSDLFDEKDILWKYKWMLYAARSTPSISLEQIEAIGDDFKTRLQRNGYSLRSYYNDRFRMNLSLLNNVPKAKEFLDLRDSEPNDDMANCHACELNDRVELELELDNIDAAITRAADLFNDKYSCAHKPFDTYCAFVEYYHRKGQLDKAHEMFLKAEEKLHEMENDSSPIGNIGVLIHFLSDYDKNKAWEYFEQYIDWSLDAVESSGFDLSINVLALLKGEGARTMQINSAMPWYKDNNTYQVADLYNYYYTRANDLAQRFDARNGNMFFTKQLNEKL